MSSIWDIANPQLRDLAVYEPGKPIEETARELGTDASKIIKLASNENPLGPSPKALAAMHGALESTHLYPDGGALATNAPDRPLSGFKFAREPRAALGLCRAFAAAKDLSSAKSAFSYQPGALPQDFDRMMGPALKARFNALVHRPTRIGAGMNCAFSAGGLHEFLGRCPRLPMKAAPLALNRYAANAILMGGVSQP